MPANRPASDPQNLFAFLLKQAKQSLPHRLEKVSRFLSLLKSREHYSYQRLILSPTGRQVVIRDPYTQKKKTMLMFASNNYLGLANHPYIIKKVQASINEYGVGMAGPPLLNGFSREMQLLEEKIAAFKGTESAVIFSTGFMANISAISALAQKNDLVIHDKLSHASLYAGLKLSGCKHSRFPHNDVEEMEKLIREEKKSHPAVFVSMEGIYSMDGDMAPLDKMVPICKKHNVLSLLDDAHGLGVLGQQGKGVAEYLGVEEQVDVHIGTFSKVFAVTGGYLAASKEIIDYIRCFAQPYIFSAALPPMTLAAVSAGIDVIENEPERRLRLLDNARFAVDQLKDFGLQAKPAAAIIAIKKPEDMDIRKANRKLHEQGVFVNSVEYPAVSIKGERFRISINADHKYADIERLRDCMEKVWNDPDCRIK